MPRRSRRVDRERRDGAPADESRAARTAVFAKTKMCKFHILGICMKGEACHFAHDREEMSVLPDLYRTKLCKNLINTGRCEDEECRYAHNKEEMRVVPGFNVSTPGVGLLGQAGVAPDGSNSFPFEGPGNQQGPPVRQKQPKAPQPKGVPTAPPVPGSMMSQPAGGSGGQIQVAAIQHMISSMDLYTQAAMLQMGQVAQAHAAEAMRLQAMAASLQSGHGHAGQMGAVAMPVGGSTAPGNVSSVPVDAAPTAPAGDNQMMTPPYLVLPVGALRPAVTRPTSDGGGLTIAGFDLSGFPGLSQGGLGQGGLSQGGLGQGGLGQGGLGQGGLGQGGLGQGGNPTAFGGGMNFAAGNMGMGAGMHAQGKPLPTPMEGVTLQTRPDATSSVAHPGGLSAQGAQQPNETLPMVPPSSGFTGLQRRSPSGTALYALAEAEGPHASQLPVIGVDPMPDEPIQIEPLSLRSITSSGSLAAMAEEAEAREAAASAPPSGDGVAGGATGMEKQDWEQLSLKVKNTFIDFDATTGTPASLKGSSSAAARLNTLGEDSPPSNSMNSSNPVAQSEAQCREPLNVYREHSSRSNLDLVPENESLFNRHVSGSRSDADDSSPKALPEKRMQDTPINGSSRVGSDVSLDHPTCVTPGSDDVGCAEAPACSTQLEGHPLLAKTTGITVKNTFLDFEEPKQSVTGLRTVQTAAGRLDLLCED